jgi:hypothetical protein
VLRPPRVALRVSPSALKTLHCSGEQRPKRFRETGLPLLRRRVHGQTGLGLTVSVERRMDAVDPAPGTGLRYTPNGVLVLAVASGNGK